ERRAGAGRLTSALWLSLVLSRTLLDSVVSTSVLRRLGPTAVVQMHVGLLRPERSLLAQRAVTRPSWGQLMQLWLLTDRSRARALVEMLSVDSYERLAWLWEGRESPNGQSPSVGYRLSRVAKLLLYQLGVYAARLSRRRSRA